MKKLVSNLIAISMVVVMAWGILSYIEIMCKNLDENPQYSDYNIIVNFTEWWVENH